MKTSSREPSTAKTLPFPQNRELFDAVDNLDADLNKLRDSVANEDLSSVRRTAALLHVNILTRIWRLLDLFDASFGYEMFVSDNDERDLRRIGKALDLFRRLFMMHSMAMDGVIACFGGYKAIEFDAIANWTVAGDPAGRPDPERVDLLARVIEAKK